MSIENKKELNSENSIHIMNTEGDSVFEFIIGYNFENLVTELRLVAVYPIRKGLMECDFLTGDDTKFNVLTERDGKIIALRIHSEHTRTDITPISIGSDIKEVIKQHGMPDSVYIMRGRFRFGYSSDAIIFEFNTHREVSVINVSTKTLPNSGERVLISHLKYF